MLLKKHLVVLHRVAQCTVQRNVSRLAYPGILELAV